MTPDLALAKIASESYGEFTARDIEVLKRVRSETLKAAIKLLSEKGHTGAAALLTSQELPA